MTKYIFVIILITADLVSAELDVLMDFEKFYKYLKENLPSTGISASCNSELTEILTNNDTLYDLYDATSKYPWNGLKTGTKSDWGNYDQCINIDHSYSEGKILGKYCLYGLVLVNEGNSLALCIPSGCTADDYNSLFKASPFTFIFQDSICHTKEYSTGYTGGDIAMIVVFIAFAIVILISTIYDVYLDKTEKKTAHALYVAFSAYTNLRKLLHTSAGNKEHIEIFNGLKSFFMMWVIAAHGISFWLQLVVLNNETVQNFPTKLKAVYIGVGFIAVDGFFFMSGFLQAYLYLKQKTTSVMSQIKNIPFLIIHRYIRLTPAMAMTYFTYITLYRHIVSGPPVTLFYGIEAKSCRQNWLPFFLYYQNYHNNDSMCLGHTWYLSVDMQLFLIAPVILVPVATLLGKREANFKPVMYILLALNIFFVVMPIVTQLLLNQADSDHLVHTRLSVYAIGIMMGTFMRKKKDEPFLNNLKRKWLINLGIWIVVLSLMVISALIYQHYYKIGYSQDNLSISHNLLGQIWCLGLCWMVYSSYHGYGGIINWILTRPTLQIVAKSSYSMYLMHWLVLIHFLLLMTRTRLYFHEYIAFINFCGFFVVSFALAIIWCISFESPMMTIEKLIFGGGGGGRVGKSGGGEQKGNNEKSGTTHEQPVPSD